MILILMSEWVIDKEFKNINNTEFVQILVQVVMTSFPTAGQVSTSAVC